MVKLGGDAYAGWSKDGGAWCEDRRRSVRQITDSYFVFQIQDGVRSWESVEAATRADSIAVVRF